MGNEATDRYRESVKGVLTNIYDHLRRRNRDKFGEELPFSLVEFQKRYEKDKKFVKLYTCWKESEYQYYKKPSIDRKNPDKPYSFENMEIMTWEENRRKGEKERSRITTSVSMFSIDGEHIADFKSIKEAVAKTGLNQSGITSCCTGRYRSTGGYVFKYKSSGYRKTREVIGNIHDKEDSHA